MNALPLLFLGVLVAVATSWSTLVFVPYIQLAHEQPATRKDTGRPYPEGRPGLAQQGADVYRSLGCVACHSQQVRPADLASDIGRGWGGRRSVAKDYLYEEPVQLGSMRWGPDLANYGALNRAVLASGTDRGLTNAFVHTLVHLYRPRLVTPKSVMPPYPFLFETRRAVAGSGADALPLAAGAVEPGMEVVPKAEAVALTHYLLILRADAALFEAPVPGAATNGPASGTNLVAGLDTNLVALTNAAMATNAPGATNAAGAANSAPAPNPVKPSPAPTR
jgi:cytochrome c oxidase cbb3-type subunit 2